MNIYPVKRKGYYIYKLKLRNDRYVAKKVYGKRQEKAGLFYTLEEAIAWLDSLP